MHYFVDIFTLETWTQAKIKGFEVSGFPPPTSSRGGYYESTFEAVKVGDVLCCYIKAPAKRWVGALRVKTRMYIDHEDPIWGQDEYGSVRFPARFRTSAIVALDPEQGLPVEHTIGVLACMDEASWGGLFRRSLMKMPDRDGEKLLELLRESREPSPMRIPRRRLQRAKAKTRDEGKPKQIRLPALEETQQKRGAPHRELMWKLIQLGKNLGCDVWVAPDERGHSFESNAFKDHVLHDFPRVGLDPESSALVRTIDVLWVKGRAVAAAFEVEVTTSIYSGLLRMSDLVALQPNTSIDIFIVAPDDRANKVRTEILRPTFETFEIPLRKRCRFLSSTALDRCIERTQPPLNRRLPPSVIKDFAEEVAPQV